MQHFKEFPPAPQSLLTFGVINNTIITQTLAFQKSKKKKEKRNQRIQKSNNPKIKKNPIKSRILSPQPISPFALTELT
jgi:hypothetical protein